MNNNNSNAKHELSIHNRRIVISFFSETGKHLYSARITQYQPIPPGVSFANFAIVMNWKILALVCKLMSAYVMISSNSFASKSTPCLIHECKWCIRWSHNQYICQNAPSVARAHAQTHSRFSISCESVSRSHACHKISPVKNIIFNAHWQHCRRESFSIELAHTLGPVSVSCFWLSENWHLLHEHHHLLLLWFWIWHNFMLPPRTCVCICVTSSTQIAFHISCTPYYSVDCTMTERSKMFA